MTELQLAESRVSIEEWFTTFPGVLYLNLRNFACGFAYNKTFALQMHSLF